MPFLNRRTVVAIAAIALAVSASSAIAKPSKAKSFYSKGFVTLNSLQAAFTPGGTDFSGTGSATGLGNITQTGHLHLGSPNPQGMTQGSGTTNLTFMNGSHLYCTFTGQFSMSTGLGTGTVTFVGGTGQFAGASGSATLAVFSLIPSGKKTSRTKIEIRGTFN